MHRLQPDPDRDVFLIVDVQNDFCTGGALAVTDGEQVVPVVNRLMPCFRSVVLTQDWHPRHHSSFASRHADHEPFQQIDASYGPQTLWPDHCVQGSRGAEFHPLLFTTAARLTIRKGTDPAIDSYSAFFENDRQSPTGLGAALKELGAQRVFLAGLATDFCVYYSAMDARRLGFGAVLIEAACRAIDLDGSLERALIRMRQVGVRSCNSSQIV